MARGHDPRIHETPDASDIRNPDITHEVSDVDTRGIFIFVIVLGVIIAVALVLLRFMYQGFESLARKAEGERPVMARTTEERLPPEPRLQGAPGYRVEGQSLELKEPQAEWKLVHEKWKQELKGYGMVDRDQQIARIPIEEAMKQIAQKGIQPVKPQSSGGGGNQQQQQQGQTTPSASQPSDSGSGRRTERTQP